MVLVIYYYFYSFYRAILNFNFRLATFLYIGICYLFVFQEQKIHCLWDTEHTEGKTSAIYNFFMRPKFTQVSKILNKKTKINGFGIFLNGVIPNGHAE